jgi:hypothetical protein
LAFLREARQEQRHPTFHIEAHYEVLKELCLAVLTLDGWNALNHECIFAYIKEQRPDLELDTDYLLDLKDLRNSIAYEGTTVSFEFWQHNKPRTTLMIEHLRKHVRGRTKGP